MERIYYNLLKSLGFISVSCLQKEERFKIIDYSVIVGPAKEAEYYDMELVFGLRIDDNEKEREIWCYRHDYVYVVIVNDPADSCVRAEVVVNDDWREEEEVAKLKLYANDWVFVGSRLNAIQVVAKLLAEEENIIEKILFQ